MNAALLDLAESFVPISDFSQGKAGRKRNAAFFMPSCYALGAEKYLVLILWCAYDF
ncbi:MAG: hypothetical protein NC548_29300 [Lachnospiraceae bacterium]|nr:hypothetical protein [Lachnospiraceae bacterium]